MQASAIRLRTATPDDVLPLQKLCRQTFMEAFAAQNQPQNMAAYMDAAFNEAQLLAELRDEHATFFLVWDGSELIGYAKLRSSKKLPALADFRSLEIQRIYVLERMKGRKIGRLLMQTCLETARRQHCEVVWLGVWEHNPSAIAFYQRWGFEQFSSYIFHFGDEDQTDLLMRKWLNNEVAGEK